MTDLFLINLSQEHPELARIEIIRLFGNHGEWKNQHILLLEGEPEEILSQSKKSGSVRSVFRIIDQLDYLDIEHLERSALNAFAESEGNTFAVKTKRLDKQAFKELRSAKIERTLGASILKKRPRWKVDLRNPDITFYVLIWEGGIILADLLLQQRGKDYNWKAPKNLPHFRGGAMKPIFARMMANLVRPEEGEWVLDPFCGHGGLLLELVDIGASPVGLELDRRIIRQAQENLSFVGYDHISQLVMGDAFHLPFRKQSFKKIVCDPPYAIQTTTSGRKPGQLTYEWLNTFREKVTLVLALPHNLLSELPKQWKTLMEADSYVHKNLTRRIRLVTNE